MSYTPGAQCAGVSVERRWLYRATGADGLHHHGSVRWCVFGVSLALTSSGYQCVTPPGVIVSHRQSLFVLVRIEFLVFQVAVVV